MAQVALNSACSKIGNFTPFKNVYKRRMAPAAGEPEVGIEPTCTIYNYFADNHLNRSVILK